MEIINKLKSICDTKEYVDLKQMCSIHIGGIGKFLCVPSNIKELKKLIKYLQKANQYYYVIGNGTNIVFKDSGYNGVLISLKKINSIEVKGTNVFAYAGAGLVKLNYFCKEEGLSGLEWSYGIPGTVGGAVRMNAGAFGGEIKDYIKYVWVLKNGKIKKLCAKEMQFDYRTSRIVNWNEIVIRVQLCLNKGNSQDIENKQKQILAYRRCCQPYGTFNAGSVFKKTNVESAGKTIDKLGLKGVKIGDIEISKKHANFFINNGEGTSKDLKQLIDMVKEKVLNETGLTLQEEIIFVEDGKEK